MRFLWRSFCDEFKGTRKTLPRAVTDADTKVCALCPLNPLQNLLRLVSKSPTVVPLKTEAAVARFTPTAIFSVTQSTVDYIQNPINGQLIRSSFLPPFFPRINLRF